MGLLKHDKSNYDKAKQVDIKEYLQSRGKSFDAHGFCRSPFSRDSNSSFKYYKQTNSWFDWSSGFGGDIIKLVMLMDGVSFPQAIEQLAGANYAPYQPNYKELHSRLDEEFLVDRYVTTRPDEVAAIRSYAESRSIREGYRCGMFFTKDELGKWVRNPSVMYVMCDADLNPCGAKFRKIVPNKTRDGKNGDRFSCRGRQGLYVLENLIEGSYLDPVLYFVESESSANSLWEFCKEEDRNVVIISFGSVGSRVAEVPHKYTGIKDRRIIIDYDGDERLYEQRLKQYDYLAAKPIRLILPKGEDLNSLYSSKQMDIISNLIF